MPGPNPELLVTKGLFPENLPPVFTSANIWTALDPQVASYAVTGRVVGEPSIYNSSKRGNLRRLFGIPHPLFIKDQGIFFERHWSNIEAVFGASPGSASRPTFEVGRSRHVQITSHGELPKLRLKRLSRFKYCLVTDVARFYPSVYTHSFPWAIHGKSEAKADTQSNSAAVFGNKLDFILRQAQSRQTIGILVGPDASKICAEILLSAVDKRFLEISGHLNPTYLRHVDDYWIGGHSHDQCEKHLQNLRLALKEFELDISESKTRIISTKYVFGESWPSEFEREIQDSLSAFGQGSGLDPLSTLGKIIDRATRDNDEGIVKHAIRTIDERRLWKTHWDILEHFLAQCAVQFPHSFDYVARVVAWRLRTRQAIDRALWIEVAGLTVSQNGKLGRDSETLWAMWLLKELKQKLLKAQSDTLLTNSGSLVLGLLAHFRKHGLATDKALFSKLRDTVDGDPFAGAFWPLTLELTHLAEEDSNWSSAPTQPALRTLHDARASIIEWNAPPKVFSHTAPDDNDDDDAGDPAYAIEDFGADYGDDDGREGGDEEDIEDIGDNPF